MEQKYFVKKKIENRHYGIDLLRIVAIFLVILLHTVWNGGLLHNTVLDSIQYKLVWLIKIITFCAIDIFGLISGYVMYTNQEKKINYSNYIMLWLQIVFYGVLINLVIDCINPTLVSSNDYLIVLFPFKNYLYWYFNAYTGLFILLPILNKAIRNLDENILKKIFVVFLCAFSLIETFLHRFHLNYGYSFIWLVILYLMGAIIKKTGIGNKIKNYQIIIGIIILTIITYINKVYIDLAPEVLISYVSPTMLGCAILYLILFSRFKFKSFMNKFIKFVTPSVFAIYIINEHFIIRDRILYNIFMGIASESVFKILIIVVGFSLSFVIVAVLIDKIRILLFKIFRVRQIIDKFVQLINKILSKIIKCL